MKTKSALQETSGKLSSLEKEHKLATKQNEDLALRIAEKDTYIHKVQEENLASISQLQKELEMKKKKLSEDASLLR